MRVLMITGDKNTLLSGTGAHERLLLQKAQVEELVVVYWGRGSVWPKVPEGHFDVVTVQDPFWRGLFAWFVAKKYKAKFNVQIHTDLAVQPLPRHVLSQIVLRHADSVRVVSEKIKKQVEHIGVRTGIHVLPVYVDLAPFAELAHMQHPQFTKTILWFGRFEDEKDPLYALEVLEQVREKGVDAGLIMLGAGSLEKSLRERAVHLAPWVEFAAWQDPKSYIAMADVVLCTSKHESWGSSIVEALAAGVAVVAPDVGVAREAGAVIGTRVELAAKVVEVLRSGTRGVLKLQLQGKEEWARAWKESLL